MRNIVLIGLSGCGKSTLGRKAALVLNLEFIDLDSEIERKTGHSISRIFEMHGESHFRKIETEFIEEATKKNGRLLSTGGGAIIRPENMASLKKNGLIIYLDREADRIIESLAGDDSRPLLKSGPERLRELALERRPLYLKAAEVVLSNNASEDDALNSLLAAIRAETVTGGYAVIGEPIAHTLSPVIHGAIFGALGLEAPYHALHVAAKQLPAFVERARHSEIKGFNLTIPHKQAIMPLLDYIDEEAALCGAVNTVLNKNGFLAGYNTDMEGLSAALKDCGGGFAGRKILILGAGGAARSIAFKAAREGAARISIMARRLEKAIEAAKQAQNYSDIVVKTGNLEAKSITDEARQSDLIINCTPLGMHGIADDFLDFDFLDALPPDSTVCDLIYNPPESKLLFEAKKRGLAAINGLGMLIYQALLADELYLGRALDKARLYQIAALAVKKLILK